MSSVYQNAKFEEVLAEAKRILGPDWTYEVKDGELSPYVKVTAKNGRIMIVGLHSYSLTPEADPPLTALTRLSLEELALLGELIK